MNRVLLLVDAEVRLMHGLLDEYGCEVFMYLQQFGCSGRTSDAAVQHVKDYISEEWGGNIKTVEYTVLEVDEESIKKEVFEEYGECLLQCPLCDGIWWRSGHAWYLDSCVNRWIKRALGFVWRLIMKVKAITQVTNKILAVCYRTIWHLSRSVGVPMSFSRIGMAELSLSSSPTDLHARRGTAYFVLGSRLGDPVCMSNLGASYAKGLGVTKDFVRAVHWYRRSASGKCAAGLYNLACCFREGEGVEQDNKKAYELMVQAAEFGFAHAIHYLGMYKLEGQECPKDEFGAFRCFRKSARNGLADAQYDLALCYARNEGGSGRHGILALLWLLRAAWGGCLEARAIFTDHEVWNFLLGSDNG